MFSSTQQEVFELVNNQFGNDIDLTEGGNSYIFYSVLSKLIDLSNQYGIEQLNKASVLSATGNDLNSLGFLLNRTRTYERFTLSSVNLTSSDQTGIEAGYQISFTQEDGTEIFFITEQSYIPGSDNTIKADFSYIGQDQDINVIPDQSEFTIYPETGGAGGAKVTDAIGTSEYTPTPVTDESYRESLLSVYQSSSFGLDGALSNDVNNLSVVSNSRVIVGDIEGGTTIVSGKNITYNLSFGEFLVLIKYQSPAPPAINLPFIPATDIIIANAIFKRLNFLNVTFDGSKLNQVDVDVTSSIGSQIKISYYVAESTPVIIVLTISSRSPKLSGGIEQELTSEIKNYVDSLNINENLYFSEISKVADSFGVIIASATFNGASTTALTPSDDEYYSYSGVTYDYG